MATETRVSAAASKVMPLADAVERFIDPGDVVLAAYSNARPNAALMQLARTWAGRDARLTLVTAGLVSVQHALVELGVVDTVVASFVGENYPAARPNRAFQRAVSSGRVTVENWSMWALVARLVAGALGVGHLPVRSLMNSSIGEENLGRGYTEFDDPFTGERVGAVAALRPDVVLLHAAAADPAGNLILAAPYGEAHWGAMAAKKGVVATVERLIDTDELSEANTLVRIPAHVVRAVSVAPFGAHPYGLYNPGVDGIADYGDDAAFMAEVFRASRTSETFATWIDEWILGVADHDDYVKKLGRSRLSHLTGDVAPGMWAVQEAAAWDGEASPVERQVIAASRQIRGRCQDRGFDAILAGVGLANLASWMATDPATAAPNGMPSVSLMAEIGMVGYRPRPGDPFVFSHRNIPTSSMLTDVMGVLGTLVSGPSTLSLGVLGAGEADQDGNTNSTWATDGRYIVGSGGANDIASGADEVLLTVGHERLVPKVQYVTSPGVHVHSIVTSRGVFERRGDRFQLVRFDAAAGRSLEDAVLAMRAESPWEFDISSEATAESPPTPAELARLRAFDPHRIFLKEPPARR